MPPQNLRFFGESCAHIVLAVSQYLTASSQYWDTTKTAFTLVYHFVHILSISVYRHFFIKMYDSFKVIQGRKIMTHRRDFIDYLL